MQATRLANQHPHITRCLEIKPVDDDFHFILELAHCDLHDALGATRKRGFSESVFCREWLLQIASGECTACGHATASACCEASSEKAGTSQNARSMESFSHMLHVYSFSFRAS